MPCLVLLGTALVLLIVPSFALIGLVVVALAAVAAVVAVAGAVPATPYLLVRALRRRLAERHQSTEALAPRATAIAHAARATQPLGPYPPRNASSPGHRSAERR